jgi:hypothetical protein
MHDIIDTPRDTRAVLPEPGQTPRWLFVAIIILAGIVLGAAGILLGLVLSDDTTADTTTSATAVTTTEPADGSTTASTTASTTGPSTATTAPSTTATTSTTPTSVTSTSPATTAPAEATAVWPWAGSGVSYDDPVDAALGFATDFVGFTDPIAGDFQQGDGRSGEVEIRATDGGAVTTVFVRQLTGDDRWWVLGAASANIVVDEPEALAVIESPLLVAGQGRAFEGVIEIQVRADGRQDPAGSGTVLASGDEDFRPFEGSIAWSATGAERGAVVFLSRSGADGSVWEASVLRVVFE